jgi:hypothetical protein
VFYRVTNYHYSEGLQGDIAAWADSKTDQVQAIEGLIAVDAFNATPTDAIIVASYEDEAAFEAAAPTVAAVLGELGQYLTAPPTTWSGSPFWTTRQDAPATL